MTKPRRVYPATEEQPGLETRMHATIRMLFPARKRKEALVILGSMIEPIKLEEGCLSCCLYQDVQEECALMLEETWADEISLHGHLRSTEFRNVLLVVEMASEPPEIRFDRVSSSTGISTIERVRGASDLPHNENTPTPL